MDYWGSLNDEGYETELRLLKDNYKIIIAFVIGAIIGPWGLLFSLIGVIAYIFIKRRRGLSQGDSIG